MATKLHPNEVYCFCCGIVIGGTYRIKDPLLKKVVTNFRIEQKRYKLPQYKKVTVCSVCHHIHKNDTETITHYTKGEIKDGN